MEKLDDRVEVRVKVASINPKPALRFDIVRNEIMDCLVPLNRNSSVLLGHIGLPERYSLLCLAISTTTVTLIQKVLFRPISCMAKQNLRRLEWMKRGQRRALAVADPVGARGADNQLFAAVNRFTSPISYVFLPFTVHVHFLSDPRGC